MAQVSFLRDGELRWSDDGATHSFSDDATMEVAFRKAVAEGMARGDMVEGGEEREVAKALAARIGINKDLSDSRMVAYWPTGELLDKLAGAYTGAGATPKEQLHLTLLYLGDPDKDGSGPWDDDLIAACLKIWAHECYCVADCQITGVGRFVAAEDEDVIVALVDSPQIADVKRQIADTLMYRGAIPGNADAVWQAQHGFIPHITLAYVPKGSPATVTLDADEFKLDAIGYNVGAQAVVFPITGYGSASDEMATDAAFYKAGRIHSGQTLAQLQAIRDSAQAMMDAEEGRRTLSAADEPGVEKAGDLSYAITKTTASERYTFGPLYAPERKDAHGEYTDAETLQKAVWDYVRSWDENGRGINLQHDDSGNSVVGEALEICSWPYETTVKVAVPGGEEHEVVLPAGTVYMGVHWNEDAWTGIQKGAITGLSLGGRALRVSTPGVELEHMGYKHAAVEPPVEPVETKKCLCDGVATTGCPECGPVIEKAGDTMHSYEGEEGGVCEVCDKSYDGGMHLGSKNDPDAEKGEAQKAVLELTLRAAKAEAALAERRHTDAFAIKAVDALGKQPDLHVHLPEQNVNIHEAPSALDALLDAPPEE